tara:strand:- start:602 stop:763 length:162 start_codon:yes stop_codon:yes gene_type:complete
VKSKKKYYLIISQKNNWRYGAFDFSEEGKEKAEKYLKHLIRKTKDSSLKIVEK